GGFVLLVCLGRWGTGRLDRRQVQAAAEVIEDFFGAAGTATGDAEVADFQQGVEVADSAGGFDLNVGRGVLAHEGEVFDGRAAGAIAGAGFDPVGVELAAKAAEVDFVLVGEVAVLEDDFHLGPGVVGDFDHGGDVVADVTPVAG